MPDITQCNCASCRRMYGFADNTANMYASMQNDPEYFCQCELCRAVRAGLTSVSGENRDYGTDGFDQYGYDSDGHNSSGDTHADLFDCEPGKPRMDTSGLDLAELWRESREVTPGKTNSGNSCAPSSATRTPSMTN